MTSMTEVPAVEAAYLVYGAPERYWAKPVECARELFLAPAPEGAGVVEVPALIQTHEQRWSKYILGDSRGRFAEAPRATRVDVVAAVALTVGGQRWYLRTVAVASDGTAAVAFDNGVPKLSIDAIP